MTQEAPLLLSVSDDKDLPVEPKIDKKNREYIILHHGNYDPQAREKALDKKALAEQLQHLRPQNEIDIPPANTVLSTSNIYRCKQGNSEIYADDKNRYKFRDCRLIRRASPTKSAAKPAKSEVEQLPEDAPGTLQKRARLEGEPPSCSGAILYQGSTYIFNDSEPCPIPQAVFRARRPIEAEPSYYTQ